MARLPRETSLSVLRTGLITAARVGLAAALLIALHNLVLAPRVWAAMGCHSDCFHGGRSGHAFRSTRRLSGVRTHKMHSHRRRQQSRAAKVPYRGMGTLAPHFFSFSQISVTLTPVRARGLPVSRRPAAMWTEGVLMAFRRFLVASSVARLIHGALGSEWRVEGYLNGGDRRRTHVSAGRQHRSPDFRGRGSGQPSRGRHHRPQTPRRSSAGRLPRTIGHREDSAIDQQEGRFPRPRFVAGQEGRSSHGGDRGRCTPGPILSSCLGWPRGYRRCLRPPHHRHRRHSLRVRSPRSTIPGSKPC